MCLCPRPLSHLRRELRTVLDRKLLGLQTRFFLSGGSRDQDSS